MTQDLLPENEYELLSESLGREPSYVELTLFSIMWSEHCSYKSSKNILAGLPTEAPNVILGPGEDAGIIYFTEHEGEDYCIAIAHESHNHPSQLLPVEGAATGIGGIVRDVYCMGTKVFATLDPLRFGDPEGKRPNNTRFIINGVVKGIADYGNPIGVPNLGGDAYFHQGFDDNCIINVVALGIGKVKEITLSRVPREAEKEPYIFVLTGKATDFTGFGGASFASVKLDEEEEDRGAIQIHDPFLKRVLTVANFAVLDFVRERNIPIGFKDLGAGGIACATSELASSGGFGANINLDDVPISIENLPPEVTACSETQERYCLVIPESIADEILEIYNEKYDLNSIYPGASARVIGRVTDKKDFILRYKDEIVCDVPNELITMGISYDRERTAKSISYTDVKIPDDLDLKDALLKTLSHNSVCSKEPIYSHYDSTVQGNTVIPSGYADAGVSAPIVGCNTGCAVSVDGNPRYGLIDAYKAGAFAIYEACRNVVCVGARPVAITDCLNFGNPEKGDVFDDFCSAVEGISDACRDIGLIGHSEEPLPVVSGNVSFYNENEEGRAVPPSPIITCVGVIDDISSVITTRLKESGSNIFLLGERDENLGGSVFCEILDEDITAELPQYDGEKARKTIRTMHKLTRELEILSCHDISDGGLITTLVEMILFGRDDSPKGLDIDISPISNDLNMWEVLFSESGGFVFEVGEEFNGDVSSIAESERIDTHNIGKVIEKDRLIIKEGDTVLLDIDRELLNSHWSYGIREILK